MIGVGDQSAELLRLRRQLPIQVHGRQFLPYQSQIVNLDRAGCDRNGQLCAVWIEGKPTDAKMVGHLYTPAHNMRDINLLRSLFHRAFLWV